ncbi:MAG: hypothetical protein ACYC1K_03580 [Minisyncoccota bacterium]
MKNTHKNVATLNCHKFLAEVVFDDTTTLMETESHLFNTREELDTFLEEANNAVGIDDVISGVVTIH